MTKTLVALKIRAMKAAERHDDAGQGALEYVGALVIAALLVVGVYTAVNGQIGTIGSAVTNAISKILTGK
jgi:Flp pilus assembly pilin Flp